MEKNNNKESFRLLFLLKKPSFIILGLIGLCVSFLSLFVPNIFATILLTIGCTVFTLSISLPIAISFQMKHSNESFKILDTCDKAQIQSIFISRSEDSTDLQDSIEEAAQKTTSELFFLGIAFHTFFNPNVPHTPYTRKCLNSTEIKLRIMILDSESLGAKRRSEIEVGSSTISDIKESLNHGIVTTVQTRLHNYVLDKNPLKEKITIFNKMSEDEKSQFAKEMTNSTNIMVKTYENDPILFLMGFEESLFAEQYHFGRPNHLINPNSCIGKHVPVIQYRKKSKGYEFYKSHFDFMWDIGEDSTSQTMLQALNTYSEDMFPEKKIIF